MDNSNSPPKLQAGNKNTIQESDQHPLHKATSFQEGNKTGKTTRKRIHESREALLVNWNDKS